MIRLLQFLCSSEFNTRHLWLIYSFIIVIIPKLTVIFLPVVGRFYKSGTSRSRVSESCRKDLRRDWHSSGEVSDPRTTKSKHLIGFTKSPAQSSRTRVRFAGLLVILIVGSLFQAEHECWALPKPEKTAGQPGHCGSAGRWYQVVSLSSHLVCNWM